MVKTENLVPTISIYCLFDNRGIPFYIGKTKNSLEKRKKQHQIKLNIDCSIFELDLVEEKDWKFWECFWIEQLTQWGIDLLNKNKGGGGPKFHTLETRQKMSNTPRPQTSQKLKNKKRPDTSERFKGKKLNQDTIQKIINKKTNHPSYKDPKRGNKIKNSNKDHYKLDSERNQKIKQKLTNREITWSDKFKIPILQFDKKENFIKEWSSATDAALFLNKKSSAAISECCNKKRKSIYGFIWKYK
jgi:hypothetical protein